MAPLEDVPANWKREFHILRKKPGHPPTENRISHKNQPYLPPGEPCPTKFSLMFHASCQNQGPPASETFYFMALQSYFVVRWPEAMLRAKSRTAASFSANGGA